MSCSDVTGQLLKGAGLSRKKISKEEFNKITKTANKILIRICLGFIVYFGILALIKFISER